MAKTSIVIPSRNERYLQATVDDLLKHATGEVEILAMLDGGPWPNPPLRDDPRVVVVRHNEPIGMRPTINEAAQIATGTYLMKCDAHCSFAPGFDEILAADCDETDLTVPTRHSLDADTWRPKIRNFNYHALTFPFAPTEYGMGFHAVTFPSAENRAMNEARADVEVDDLMSFQGSCWFQHRANFLRLGPLDHGRFYFYQEAQEIGLRQWLTGGRCTINKKTSYAHLHKGRDYTGADGRVGRGYFLSLRRKRESEAMMVEHCLRNRFEGQTRTFDSFIEQFWPLLQRLSGSRTWPEDWREWDRHREAFENRTPNQIPEHT